MNVPAECHIHSIDVEQVFQGCTLVCASLQHIAGSHSMLLACHSAGRTRRTAGFCAVQDARPERQPLHAWLACVQVGDRQTAFVNCPSDRKALQP